MAIDPEDVAAVQRLIDRATREAERNAFAAGLRMQASTLRAEATAKQSVAHELEEMALAVLEGDADLPLRTRRVRIEFVQPEAPAPAEDEPESTAVEQLERVAADSATIMGEGHVPLSPAMGEFVDMFSARYQRSPHFEQAINEAADAGLHINRETASTVANRINELEEEGRRA